MPKKKSSKKPLQESLLIRWREYLLKRVLLRTAILAITLTIFGAGLIILAFEVWKAPSIAKLLPAEETIAFMEGDFTFWYGFSDMLTEEEKTYDGIAYFKNEKPVYFVEEGNKMIPSVDFEVEGLVLKRDPNFIKLRPNLPYEPAAFVYIDPVPFLEEANVRLPVWAPLQLAPWLLATGMAIDPQEEGTTLIQTHTVADKSLMDGEALFHLDQKYKGKLIEKFPDALTQFYGGKNLSTTFEQFVAVLNAADGSGKIYQAVLQNLFESYFGTTLDINETIYPLLENEYALGLTDESWIFAIELTNTTEPVQELLLDTLLTRGLVTIDEETSTLTQNTLFLATTEYAGHLYNTLLDENGAPVLNYFIQDDILFLTPRDAETLALLDTLSNNAGAFHVPSEILSGDHAMMTKIADGDGPTVYSSINLFDDGIATLHVIVE